jgi:hypothetical protein
LVRIADSILGQLLAVTVAEVDQTIIELANEVLDDI